MIGENIRNTVRTLFNEGKSKKEIARFLNINVKTVRNIIRNDSNRGKIRKDKIIIDVELLRKVHKRCDGYIQRMYEVLTEEYEFKIAYSTLTRLVRHSGLGDSPKPRAFSFPDIPGAEMQSDTSDYILVIGGERMKVICSGLYYRYSKMRYVKFYPRFNRFTMKCFFHEALSYFGFCAEICIIDNTHLAVLYGTGENAVFNPEMLSFARTYGFMWKAHRIKHSNRKAGKERNFLTLETNFFPGRTFKSIEDLNAQAFKWATERFALRPQAKTRLIPIELFELEKPYLVKLADYIEPPYRYHERTIDDYGYISFDGNYYWLPKDKRGKVKIIEYEKQIRIYQNHEKIINYNLPAWNVKNEKFYPPGIKKAPYEPVNRKKGCAEEEKRLRSMDNTCSLYIDFVLSKECKIYQKPKFIRNLYRLSKKICSQIFILSLQRAHKYKIANIDSLEKIAYEILDADFDNCPEVPVINNYEERESYKKGRFSNEEDLGEYSNLTNKE